MADCFLGSGRRCSLAWRNAIAGNLSVNGGCLAVSAVRRKLFFDVEPGRRLVWIVHVVRGVAEGVYFQLIQEISRHFIQQPINDHTAFNCTL